MRQRPVRVLVIGPSNIGDAILAGGVVAAVHRHLPESHLTLVVGERAQPLFAEDPRVHTLVDADAFDSPLGRLKLAFALWRYQPHVVVDLRHTLYPLLLKPLAAWRYLRQPPKPLTHMRERYLWKLRAQVPLVARARDEEGSSSLKTAEHASIWFTPKDRAHVEGLWRRWGLANASPLIVICPGARSHIKRWSIDGFARVADRLVGELHAQVVFSGEPSEEPVIEEILGLMRQRAHSAVSLVTIRQLGVLMARARLVITNDSASLHLASAVDVPTVAIFGPTDERKYGPTAAHHRTIRRRLFCAPCEQALCRFHHECMRFISPGEVLEAAMALLQEGARGTGHGAREGRRTL